MDGWPAGLFVCTYYIIYDICTISSVRRQFHVRWNHLVCPSTVPGGTVTERDKREIRDNENKGFWAFGGKPPKGI